MKRSKKIKIQNRNLQKIQAEKARQNMIYKNYLTKELEKQENLVFSYLLAEDHERKCSNNLLRKKLFKTPPRIIRENQEKDLIEAQTFRRLVLLRKF